MRIFSLPVGLLALSLSAGSAYAAPAEPASQDGVAADEGDDSSGSDDDLKDILGEPTGDDTVKGEVDAVKSGEIGDNVGDRKEEVILIEEEARKKQVIKTIQRKNFTKLHRFEASPHAAFVANDPFLNRYIVGAGLAYHVTEIFAVEGNFDFSPDLGDKDYKPLTRQLVDENHVSPDISKLNYFATASMQYAPIYGKVAVMGRNIIAFDIYGNFGVGVTHTSDDLEALQATDDPKAQATQFQFQPSTTFGGGLRVGFTPNIAARIEGRSLIYVETVNATTLEMKNNFILQASASIFFPNMKS